jgi:hypothetical protein
MSTLARIRQLGWQGVMLALRVRAARLVGRQVKMTTPDRLVLEDVLKAIAADVGIRSVLLVGSDWYCAHYPSLLPGRDVTTIDPDTRKARFGASKHIVDRLENLGKYVQPAAFDAIVCNGVYGWGLDDRHDCEVAFTQCEWSLREGGLLVLGWNDVPEHDPVPIGAIEALHRFAPYRMPEIGAQRLVVDGSTDRHTYAFFVRGARTTAAV